MLELVLDVLLWIGWSFPVWVGSSLVYYSTLGYVRCDDEMLAGCIGIAFLIGASVAVFFVFR